MRSARWRLFALALIGGLLLAYATTLLSPRRYVATGGVLMPAGMLRVQYEADDARLAAALVQGFIRRHQNPLLVDPPLVTADDPSLALNLAFGGAGGLLLGVVLVRRRRQRPVRSENQLVEVLGASLLAPRPLAPHAHARQLLAHWFRRGRPVLAVVSADSGSGRTRAAAELARAFAAMGERTLLIDADLRSPRVHLEFGLPNRQGLADFLEGRQAALAHVSEHLSVMAAGRSGADPLELLSRPQGQALLGEAAQRYSVVLIDTPAAESGPDLQLFAAFGGGALVVARRAATPDGLARLRKLLSGCRARVVGTVIAAA